MLTENLSGCIQLASNADSRNFTIAERTLWQLQMLTTFFTEPAIHCGGPLAENQGEHYGCLNFTEEEIRTVIRSSSQIISAQTLVEDERNHNLAFSPLL